ncbi:MAG TPA: GAF and ANTAR domain-containing protein [Mycobacterium sp.]|nr:GAF and ANTAR domain-containing protein [Mycobacterium sp.]
MPGGDDLTGSADDGGGRATRFIALCSAAVRTLPIAGASLALMSEGQHRGLVAASDDVASRLDDVQLTLGEGPSVDAFSRRHPVLVDDLADIGIETRWPAFAGAAAGMGARAIIALPLQIGAISLGVLTMYRGDPGGLSGEELAQALRVADAAAYALLDLAVPSVDSGSPNGTAQHDGHDGPIDAFFVGAEVHQASGMLMVQLGVPIEVALARLRAYAFAQDRPVRDVARDVVSRGLLLER